jgi:hypothetical protein
MALLIERENRLSDLGRHVNIDWISRLSALEQICSRDKAGAAILAIAINDHSAIFAEGFLLGVICTTSDSELKRAAILALGHSARVRHAIICPEAINILTSLISSPVHGGAAEDAIEDIVTFTKTRL